MAELGPLPVRVRLACRGDVGRLAEIEAATFEFPLDRDDLRDLLSSRKHVCYVALFEHLAVGHLVYRHSRSEFEICSLAVDPPRQRRGVGRAMMSRLLTYVNAPDVPHRTVSAVVRERNLAAQLFFRSLGFRAIQTLRGHWQETDEDAYVMALRPRVATARTAPAV